jgi:hypothetical protein
VSHLTWLWGGNATQSLSLRYRVVIGEFPNSRTGSIVINEHAPWQKSIILKRHPINKELRSCRSFSCVPTFGCERIIGKAHYHLDWDIRVWTRGKSRRFETPKPQRSVPLRLIFKNTSFTLHLATPNEDRPLYFMVNIVSLMELNI